jgi:hypothetical protein
LGGKESGVGKKKMWRIKLGRVESKFLEWYYESHGSGIGRQNYIERELSGSWSSGMR